MQFQSYDASFLDFSIDTLRRREEFCDDPFNDRLLCTEKEEESSQSSSPGYLYVEEDRNREESTTTATAATVTFILKSRLHWDCNQPGIMTINL